MIEYTVKLYRFDELSDDAKERAREWYRESPIEYGWNGESIDSIKAFCDHFGVTLTDWSIGSYYCYQYKHDADNLTFRGLRLNKVNREYMPTGYCLDNDLWYTFHDEFKATGSALTAFNKALDAGFRSWYNDIQWQESNEYIDEILVINEYTFLDSGEHFRVR